MINTSLIVYENDWIIRRIYEVADGLRTVIVDQTKFEERCINRVARYLNGDESRTSHRNYIERLIQQEATDYRRRGKKEDAELFTTLATSGDDGELIEYEPEDVLADVEGEVISKEMAALLAQGDRRKELIVGSWTIGNDNNSEISRLLAQSIGGNPESHRKFIQRFRADCREMLATAI